jgi:hypothetical protein
MADQVQRGAVRVRPGDRVRLELPHSEVCMHMQVAGKVMTVEVNGGELPDGRPWSSAQLLNDDGSHFSCPIGIGEAGIYGSPEALYCYPVEASTEPRP